MEVLLDRGRKLSGDQNLNYVAVEDNVYVIDNHLAAIWCMEQLDTTKTFNLLHIDRHYDLVRYNEEFHATIHETDLNEINIENLTSITTLIDNVQFQVYRWDNYLNLFNEKFPDTIKNTTFITQKEGEFNYAKDYEELEIYDLFAKIFETENKWIFNIDLDYFFTRPEDDLVQMYTDEFIEEFAKWLNREHDKAELIILCLSPECCGGWENAIRVLNIVLSALDIQEMEA